MQISATDTRKSHLDECLSILKSGLRDFLEGEIHFSFVDQGLHDILYPRFLMAISPKMEGNSNLKSYHILQFAAKEKMPGNIPPQFPQPCLSEKYDIIRPSP